MAAPGSESVTVRAATTADAEAIAAVRVRGWQHGYAGVVPSGVLDSLSPQRNLDRLRAQIDRPLFGQSILVSELDGAITGFVNCGPYRVAQKRDLLDPDVGGEVYAIYVDPARWRHGAGTALLSEAVRRLRAAELFPVSLWVLADNPRARRFYERFGFRFDGTTEPYVVADGTVLDEVRYRLDSVSAAGADDEHPG